MRPRGQRVLRDTETSLLLIPSRGRFNQTDYAVLTEAIQVSIGIDQRPFPNTPIAPRNLARIKLDRRQNRTRESVKIVANQHRSAVMVAHVFRKPDFLRLVI